MLSNTNRLTWRVDEWPAIDVTLWHAAREISGPFRPFRERSRAAQWTPSHRRKIEEAYGQFLAWLYKKGQLDPGIRPALRIAPDRVEQYVAELRLRVAPVTVAINICYLSAMIRAIEPTVNWDWLQKAGQHLKAAARPIRDKRQAVVPAKDLYDLGVNLMRSAGACETRSAATQFRDGLIIAFLITLPLRLSNFSSIQLGKHLVHDNGQYWLMFSGEETKNERPIEGRVPDELAVWLEYYLRHYRHGLAQRYKDASRPATRALWVNWDGSEMSRGAIRKRIVHHTKIAFGHAVWPHLFRDCVATSFATEAPEHVQLIADIFGHATSATADRYYNQASSLSASRTYQRVIRAIRREAALEAEVDDSERFDHDQG